MPTTEGSLTEGFNDGESRTLPGLGDGADPSPSIAQVGRPPLRIGILVVAYNASTTLRSVLAGCSTAASGMCCGRRPPAGRST